MARAKKALPNLRYRYHCMKCRRWARFERPISDYIRPRKCWFCGSTKFYRIAKRKQVTCYCNAYWFPHRYVEGECGMFAEPHTRKRRRGSTLF